MDMNPVDHNALNDDGLNAYLFGLVFDCPITCHVACPVHNLPLPSLSDTFDAIFSMPRDNKLELIDYPLQCTRRMQRAAHGLRELKKTGENCELDLADITHLIPEYLDRY